MINNLTKLYKKISNQNNSVESIQEMLELTNSISLRNERKESDITICSCLMVEMIAELKSIRKSLTDSSLLIASIIAQNRPKEELEIQFLKEKGRKSTSKKPQN